MIFDDAFNDVDDVDIDDVDADDNANDTDDGVLYDDGK
jgi:hypothetical protein